MPVEQNYQERLIGTPNILKRKLERDRATRTYSIVNDRCYSGYLALSGVGDIRQRGRSGKTDITFKLAFRFTGLTLVQLTRLGAAWARVATHIAESIALVSCIIKYWERSSTRACLDSRQPRKAAVLPVLSVQSHRLFALTGILDFM